MAGIARTGDGAEVTAQPIRPEVPAARYRERLDRLAALSAARGFDGVFVGVGPDLAYLTGYRALPLERLTMLAVVHGSAPVLVVPRLERGAAEAGLRIPLEIRTWEETDDPYELVLAGLHAARPDEVRIAVSDRLWASHLLHIQARLAGDGRFAGSAFAPASTVLRELRMRKDDDEIGLLRLAAQAADRVVAAIAAGPLVGRTEADVSAEIRERLVGEGHEAASFAIVASGPNSASPHHDASERSIRPGEPIVLDIGGTLGGYGSDITRMLWVTGEDPTNGPDDAFRNLYMVLREAQAAATAAVRPGIPCASIDAVARDRIGAAGYGERFIHRTGHGIGLEEHEDPYIVAGNDEALGEGMAFSIEPGIYLEGRYGARIEDIVVCGPDGPIVLNEAPRDLLAVPG
jgi:Xaa-Pro aminopeptidase